MDVKYLPQMADQDRRRYLFVAIDRATRRVFIRVFNAKTAVNARRFPRDLERACPIRIRTILTDNGKAFTNRLFGLRKRAPTGEHQFDQLCAALDIEYHLTPPKSPRQMAGSSASTVVSGMCSKAITSGPVRKWRQHLNAMSGYTASSFPKQLRETKPLCRP